MSDDQERRFLWLPIWKWDGLSGFFSLLGLLGVVVAAAIAIWELRENRRAERVAQTLDLLNVWEEHEYLAAFRRLDAEIISRLELVPPDDLASARSNSVILDRLYERVAAEVLLASDAREDFENLIYFFNRLSICVEETLCAREPTLAFFRGPMRSFAQIFKAEIEARRISSPDFAKGLDLAS